MADTRKYMDELAAQELVKQIKAEDTKTLASAIAHANNLGDNYDVAGSAATAEHNAKKYTDDEISKVKTSVNTNKDAIDTINNTDTGILAQAKADAKAKADAVDAKVAALDKKVGDLPTGTDIKATTVVEYVDEKVVKAISDTTTLAGRVTQAEADIDAIEKDYLKTADKTELEGKVSKVDGKVNSISDKVTTLVGEDTDKSVRKIANEELTAQLIPENAKDSLDTLQEIAAWIQSHPEDASAMNTAIQNLTALVGTIPEDVTDAKTIIAYIQKLVMAEETRAKGVESSIDTRLKAVEGKVGTGDSSVSAQIEAAKSEAISTAAADATSKANEALEGAKAYTNTEVEKDRARLSAVEAKANIITNFIAITTTEIDEMFETKTE